MIDTVRQPVLPSISLYHRRITRRHEFFFQKIGRVYHEPDRGRARPEKNKRSRVKHPPRHTEFGHFQEDSFLVFMEGLRRYIMTATDTRLDFSLSACYSELTSRAGKDFIKRFEVVYPSKVKSIQTDNDSEFLDEFSDYLRRRNTPHYFSYRRCPRINGCIERYHRTLKEEFILNSLDVIDDMGLFGKKLVDYVIDLSEGNRTTTNSYMIDRED